MFISIVQPPYESPFVKRLLAEHSQYNPDNTEKLLADVSDKTKYGCHLDVLKFYLQMGMKLRKVRTHMMH